VRWEPRESSDERRRSVRFRIVVPSSSRSQVVNLEVLESLSVFVYVSCNSSLAREPTIAKDAIRMSHFDKNNKTEQQA